MAHPDEHGSPFAKQLMELHQLDGLVVAAIVLANLIWACIARGEAKQRQIQVLISRQNWYDAYHLLKKIPTFLKNYQQSFIHSDNILSKIIEMLGLMTMVGMAITGTLIWFNNDGGEHSHAHVSFWVETLMTSHSWLSKLLWLYISGHVFMAYMHVRAGSRPFARILPFGK